MKNMRRTMTMALAGTLLAGTAVRAQAQTAQVSAQEVAVKLRIEIARMQSLNDTMEKLIAAYKADPRSPKTLKLEADYCRSQALEDADSRAFAKANADYYENTDQRPGRPDELHDLDMQEAGLAGGGAYLHIRIHELGITCPSAPLPQAETLAESGALGTARPSAENPIKGQMMLMVYFVVGLVLYFLPSVVGDRKRNRWAIFTLNLLLGWTILGWIGALVWALCAEPSLKPVLSHSANNAMSQNAFCGHCGSPVTTAYCRNCGRRAAL
jgi:hypothetical protein